MVTVPVFDPQSERLMNDPYSVFAEYRQADPVHWGKANIESLEGSWYCFRYEENAIVLGDADTYANDPASADRESSMPEAFRPMAKTFQRWLGGRDGQDHKRLRVVLAKAFTPRRLGALRPRVQEIVDMLIERGLAKGNGTFDIVRDLSFPLPMAFVGDALGVKQDDWHLFQNWAEQITQASNSPSDVGIATAGGEAIEGMVSYFGELVARRRVEPTDDLLGAMVAEADDDGVPMNELDVIAIATELGFAGHETVAKGIGKAVLGMMEQRDRWLELGTLNDGGLDQAIDELLRWTCPVQRQRWRWVLKDTTLDGRKLERGQAVVAVLAAANRDPNHFPDPDRIDFHRTNGQHMTFGLGNHFCIGSQLARYELRSALGSMARRFPDLRLAVDPQDIPWERVFGVPGPKSVPVVI